MSAPQAFRFLILLSVLLGTPLPVFGQSATPVAQADVFRDRDGRYTVPIPNRWSAMERDGYVELADPDSDLHVYVVVVPAQTARVGIRYAWAIALPDYDLPSPVDSDEFDPPPGTDEHVIVTADYGDQSGEFAQAAAWRVDAEVYAVLIHGSVNGRVHRNAEIMIIMGGLKFSAVPVIRLPGLAVAPFEGDLIEEFETYVVDLMQRTGVPGASIAVVVDGEVVLASGYGVTELGGDQPVDANTRMMVGSITTSMTTMMMASAVDDGLFLWDTPVTDLYPSFETADPELTATLTMADLVCACSGIPRRDMELILNGNDLSPEEVIAWIKWFGPLTDFGESFQYNNQLVAAAGYIAADSGYDGGDLEADYRSAMDARVFQPIGMDSTSFALGSTEPRNNTATPHGLSLFDGYVPLRLADEDVMNAFGPAGAAWSTATDMSQYLITQMQNGVAPDRQRVVSEENLLETRKPRVEITASIDYGLGWMVGSYRGLPVILHGGGTMGFTSEIAFLPAADVGIVVLANASGAGWFTEGVRQRLFELVYGLGAKFDAEINDAQIIADRDLLELRSRLEERPDADSVQNIVGDYWHAALGSVSIYYDEQDRLMADIGEFAFEVRIVTSDGAIRLAAIDPPLMGITFSWEDAGSSGAYLVIRSGPGMYYFERVYP